MKKILIFTAIFINGCVSTQPETAKGLENTPEIQVNSPEMIKYITDSQKEKQNEN